MLSRLWAHVEWQDNGGFERCCDDGGPGDRDPWILAVGGIWALAVLGLFALRAVWHACERLTDAPGFACLLRPEPGPAERRMDEPTDELRSAYLVITQPEAIRRRHRS